jgi:hypothetical protein
MHKLPTVLLIGLLLLTAAGAAYAHGEIVYSARYYLTPGSKGHSYYHIYRIDPDGKNRVQLTFDKIDDYDPQWRSNGTQIAFTREPDGSLGPTDFLMNADGTGIHKIKNGLDPCSRGSSIISSSPNGRYKCIATSDQNYYQIIDSVTNQTMGRFSDQAGDVLWLSNQKLAVLSGEIQYKEHPDEYYVTYEFTTYDIHGKQLASIILTDLTPHNALYNAQTQWSVNFGFVDYFHADPLRRGCYYFTMMGHKETLGWMNSAKKTVRIASTAMSVSGSPDRSKVCVSVFFGPMPYQRRSNGEWRTVWTSYLAIIDHISLKVHYIQSGRISCEGADWRHGVDDNPW